MITILITLPVIIIQLLTYSFNRKLFFHLKKTLRYASIICSFALSIAIIFITLNIFQIFFFEMLGFWYQYIVILTLTSEVILTTIATLKIALKYQNKLTRD